MVLSIFHWLVIISIIVLPFSRKWVDGMWKWIFRLGGKLVRFIFAVLRKLGGLVWILIAKIIGTTWALVVNLAKGLFWLVPRIAHWFGWLIIEGFRFLFNALRALVEILKP